MEDILDKIINNMCPLTVTNVLLELGFDQAVEAYTPATASHLVSIHCDSDYNFNITEYNWLLCAERVLSYKIRENVCAFFIDLSCDIDDYYTHAAAVVKIMNRAFQSKNVFVFRINENIALGIARELEVCTPNNFAVSGLINCDNYLDYDDLLNDISIIDVVDLPERVIDYSPQEKKQIQTQTKRKFDWNYLEFLHEFEYYYGVDTSRQRYQYLFEEENYYRSCDESYESTCHILRFVAEEDTESSYFDLLNAQKSQERSELLYDYDDDIDDDFIDDDLLTNLSEDAYKDAEQMLKELLDRNK